MACFEGVYGIGATLWRDAPANNVHFYYPAYCRVAPYTVAPITEVGQVFGTHTTADDFLRQLAKPFQLELSMKHIELVPFDFGVSISELVMTTELSRTPMTTRSVCEAVGAEADAVLREIAEISEHTAQLRRKVANSGPEDGD